MTITDYLSECEDPWLKNLKKKLPQSKPFILHFADLLNDGEVMMGVGEFHDKM